jgi:hypothetical protein
MSLSFYPVSNAVNRAGFDAMELIITFKVKV